MGRRSGRSSVENPNNKWEDGEDTSLLLSKLRKLLGLQGVSGDGELSKLTLVSELQLGLDKLSDLILHFLTLSHFAD